MTPTGEIRWPSSQGTLTNNDDLAAQSRMIGIIQNITITQRKRHEQDLRDLADARGLLVREADPRIENSLHEAQRLWG